MDGSLLLVCCVLLTNEQWFSTATHISISHACFSHQIIREIGGGTEVIQWHPHSHQDIQIALYILVWKERFDGGNFGDMLHHTQGSVYLERVGLKLKKPGDCNDCLFLFPGKGKSRQ